MFCFPRCKMVPKDPHLIDSKMFGLPGTTVTRGGTTFSLCTNTFGPPHSLCKMTDDEVKHKANIRENRKEKAVIANQARTYPGFNWVMPAIIKGSKINPINETRMAKKMT